MLCKLASKSAYDLINKCIMVITSVSMIPRNRVDSEFVQYSCGCFISLSKGKKSFPVTSITLELVSCPTRFPSCRRNSLLKSNPRYYFFQRLVFNLYYPNNIQRYEIFFFPSNNFSKFFSKSFFPPLPPRFWPSCHWRFSLTRQRDSR